MEPKIKPNKDNDTKYINEQISTEVENNNDDKKTNLEYFTE